MAAEHLSGGFADPPREAAHAFRAVMQAMARPGQIARLSGATPPAPLSPAVGTVLLTLCDPTTPVHLAAPTDSDAVRAWIGFQIGAPLTGKDTCAFAVGPWDALAPLDPYPAGTPEYPDRSATLIVEVPVLEPAGVTLRGPGIAETAALSLPETAAFQRNAAHYPLGLDFILTCGDRIAALPRSTRIG